MDWNGPSGKHPFEKIVFAHSGTADDCLLSFPERKFVVSVPSAIHSFKPPLERIIQPYVKDRDFLELFARSLTPDGVSLGNQLPLLQHASLFSHAND